MELIVDQDLCISCGLCIEICPEIFDWNNDDLADVQVQEIPDDGMDCSLEALESCPVEAIQKK